MSTTTTEITADQILDVRDIIARVEDLREGQDDEDERAELAKLEELLASLKGYGGDEKWEGSWYPLTLIRDDYFADAMEELVKDIGDLPHDIPDYLVIDWEATAKNLRVDYASVEFDGETYWYR